MAEKQKLRWKVTVVHTLPEQMALLWRQVEKHTGHPRLRELLARVMRRYDVPARDPAALAAGFQKFQQEAIKYLRETPETYASPLRTLNWRVGDCDDLTILTCAGLRGVRIPCRAVFVGWVPKDQPGRIPLKHVYPQAWDKVNHWRTYESVRAVPPGWDVARIKKKEGYRVRVVVVGDKAGVEPDVR